MDAIQKTNNLERRNLLITEIKPQTINPNKMSAREFNLLCDNLQQVGFVDPVFVRPLPEGGYRIIGGYHRVEAAKLLGFTEVPCTICVDDDFTEDLEKFQIVRMNMIHGQMQPADFLKLYESLSEKYENDIMVEAFALESEDEFKKLIGQFAKVLPVESRAEFKKAAKEMKTIEGLSTLLNKMFNTYGDTLPYGFMIVDFGGQDSVWLRMEPADRKNINKVLKDCQDANRGVDVLFKMLIKQLAAGELTAVAEMLKDFPPVVETLGA